MNKFWKEIERLSNKSEAQINKELARAYKWALEDLKMRIGAFMAEHQEFRYVDLLQLNKLESLYKQVDAASKKLVDGLKDNTYKADLRELELGYFGEFYNIESQLNNLNMGSNLSFGLMSEEYIKQVIEYPVNGVPLSKRLYGETLSSMQRQIKATITEGLIQGYSYKEISRNLSESMGNSYKKSKVIVRTESGRVRSMARQESIDKAKELGVDLKKEWISTLDLKTRHSHASMDGQVVGTDEEFTSPRGHKSMQPRMFGVAAEDINCRCGCTSVVNGISAKNRRDNIDKTVENYRNYEEWLKNKHPKEYANFKKISGEISENSGIIVSGSNINMSVDIEIDDLTPCLVERSTGKIVNTEIVKANIKKSDYKGWNFDWSIPKRDRYDIHALKTVETDDIQGLIASIVDTENKAVHVDIVETAPHNFGKLGKYEGVGAHLFAFACKQAKDAGYDYIYFDAKTNLIEYYKDRLGASQIGNTQRMLIEGDSLERLFQTYYGGE